MSVTQPSRYAAPHPPAGQHTASPAAAARVVAALAAIALLLLAVWLQPERVLLLIAAGALGLLALAASWRMPELGLVGLVFLGSRILDPHMIEIRLPIGGGLELPDLALAGLGAMALVRLWQRRYEPLPASWPSVPLLVFLWLAVLSAAYALFVRGVEPSWALTELRGLGYYSVFFLILLEIRRPAQMWRLLAGLFGVGLLTVLIMLIQQFVGPVPLLASLDSTSWQIIGGDGGLTRIRPPGHVLLYFLSIAAVVLGVLARRPGQRLALLGLGAFMNLALLLTFTRSQWVASALALVVCLVLLPSRIRLALVAAGICLVAVGVLVLAAQRERLAEFVSHENFATPLVARLESVFELDETLDSYSARTRYFQTEAALEAIREEPWTGVGLGNAYRGLTSEEARTRYTRFVRFIENSYLYLTTKMGLPALIVFGVLALTLLISGLRTYLAAPEGNLKALSLACLASFVGILVWGFLHPLLMLPEYTLAIGVVAGISEATGQLIRNRTDQHDIEEQAYESSV
jgi:O-antigen ligase